VRPMLRTTSVLSAATMFIACAEATSPPRTPALYGDIDVTAPQLSGLRRASSTLHVTHSMTLPDDSSPPPTGGTTPSWVASRTPGLINLHWTDAGFTGSTSAWAEAYMKYWATNADQTVSMSLRYKGSPVGSNSSHDANDDLFPGSRELRTDTGMGTISSCGFLSDATGTHSVGMKFLASGAQGWLEWGKSTVSDYHSASQPACTTAGGGQSLASGGTGYVVCYYWIYTDAYGNYLGESERFGCYYVHDFG
jgi:hypothetical protein